jgi:chromosome segregation ATPase
MTDVTLEFLGEQMKSMQADIRRIDRDVGMIKDKLVRVEAEQVELRQTLYNVTGEFNVRMINLERRFETLEQRFETLEQRFEMLEQRFEKLVGDVGELKQDIGRFEASVNERFRQMAETSATNLQVVLAAIAELRPRPA